MKINIILSNPKACDDCPLLDDSGDYGPYCPLRYDVEWDLDLHAHRRPQKCIDDNGE